MSLKVIFIDPQGNEIELEGEGGMSVLQLAQENGIDMEGACEGNMACSTCHVIIDKSHFDMLPEASEEEEEMLDLASGLRATSRLGCQVMLEQKLDGLRLHLPKESKNMLGF